MPKKYDLAVRAGQYTNRNGEEKVIWKNVGYIGTKKDGGFYMKLDRTFNPAGIDVDPGESQIFVSLFEPKQREQKQAPEQNQGFDDSIPF